MLTGKKPEWAVFDEASDIVPHWRFAKTEIRNPCGEIPAIAGTDILPDFKTEVTEKVKEMVKQAIGMDYERKLQSTVFSQAPKQYGKTETMANRSDDAITLNKIESLWNKHRADALESEVGKLNSEVFRLTAVKNRVEAENSELKAQIDDLHRRLERRDAHILELENKMPVVGSW